MAEAAAPPGPGPRRPSPSAHGSFCRLQTRRRGPERRAPRLGPGEPSGANARAGLRTPRPPAPQPGRQPEAAAIYRGSHAQSLLAAAATAEYFAQIWLGPRRGGREPREREGYPGPGEGLPGRGAAGAGAGDDGASAGGRRTGAVGGQPAGERSAGLDELPGGRGRAGGRALWAPGVGARGGPGSALSPRPAPPAALSLRSGAPGRRAPFSGRGATPAGGSAGQGAGPPGSCDPWTGGCE